MTKLTNEMVSAAIREYIDTKDEDVLKRLMTAFHPSFICIMRKRLSGKEIAAYGTEIEMLVWETCIPKFPVIMDNPVSYICLACQNKVKDFLKQFCPKTKDGSMRKVSMDTEDEEGKTVYDFADPRADRNPEQNYMIAGANNELLNEIVDRYVPRLDKEVSRAIYYVYICQLKRREAAEAMNVTESVLNSRVQSGLKKLRRMIAADGDLFLN